MSLYLSFAGDEGWRGLVLIDDGTAAADAARECWRRGCNPGGEVMIIEYEPDDLRMSDAEREWFANAPRWTLITTPSPGAQTLDEAGL